MKFRILCLVVILASVSGVQASSAELRTIHCLSSDTERVVFEVFVKIDQHPKGVNVIIFGADEPIKLSKPISITVGQPYTRLAGTNVYHANLFGTDYDLNLYMDARIGFDTELIVSRGFGTIKINGASVPLNCGGM